MARWGYRTTSGRIGMAAAARWSGHVGAPSGVATARFVVTRVVVVGGTHVRISSNLGGRVEFSVAGFSEAIVSFTRSSTVRLTGSRSWATGLLGCGHGPEDVGLDEVIPAARAADLDHMDRKFLLGGSQPTEFVGRSRGAGQGSELLAEHPRHQRELLLPADRAHYVAAAAVELGGT